MFKRAIILIPALLLSASTISDDTEIFFENGDLPNSDDARSNVLFILDTSGSMNSLVPYKAPYDASTDYGSSAVNSIYAYDGSDHIATIPSASSSCKTMIDEIAADNDRPFYFGRAAYWDEDTSNPGNSAWQDFTNNGSVLSVSSIVECEQDEGSHGQSTASNSAYAINGEFGPYATVSPGISWVGFDQYQYVSANYHDYLQQPFIDPSDSGTICDNNNTNNPCRKINILKEATTELINNLEGVNIGLMRFNESQCFNNDACRPGGRVIHHFSNVSDTRSGILAAINSLSAGGSTPLTESLWEAHLYYSGSAIEFGNQGNSPPDPNALSSGIYNSPVKNNSCQTNHIVLLTDGRPQYDAQKDGTISSLASTCNHTGSTASNSSSNLPDAANETCLDELAAYIGGNNTAVASTPHDYSSGSQGLSGTQSVTVHTIGFFIDANGDGNPDPLPELLTQGATNGGGNSYATSTSQELLTAFSEILGNISQQGTSFIAPAVSVNAFNSLQHRNELYFALFEPSNTDRWYGNLKKYRIDNNGVIRDADNSPPGGNEAVSANTGFFFDDARSFWSSSDDGTNVREGGAAEQLTNTRTVYTNNTAGTTVPFATVDGSGTVNFDASITPQMLGLTASATPDEFDTLLHWTIGGDYNSTTQLSVDSDFLADPLHSRPVVVTYGGTASSPDDTVFFTTNTGSLHAIDGSNSAGTPDNGGSERFAFIPQELLPLQNVYFSNENTGVSRNYGLDGPMNIWVQESDDTDVTIEPLADNDHVYVYVGMRRGGRNYYAFDVSDRSNPSILWTISGNSSDFSSLGQTWSALNRAKIYWDCDSNSNTDCDEEDERQVLFFGGGYDTDQDTATSAAADDLGAVIYMVDAKTGEKLWEARNGAAINQGLNLGLTNSIPGDVTPVDVNGDGLTDVLFAVDVLGHLWRIDLNDTPTSTANFATGGQIADLSDDGFRRFFVGPNVAFSRQGGTSPMFVISIGSGYTPHPLSTTGPNNRLYVVFERDFFAAPERGSTPGVINYGSAINGSSLFDIVSQNAPADPTNPNINGYFREAQSGEKFLRPSATVFGVTLYTSFIPPATTTATCNLTADIGTGRLYAIDFLTGQNIFHTKDFVELKHGGIPPAPVILFLDSGGSGVSSVPIVCVGTECLRRDDPDPPLPNEDPIQKIFWRENTP